MKLAAKKRQILSGAFWRQVFQLSVSFVAFLYPLSFIFRHRFFYVLYSLFLVRRWKWKPYLAQRRVLKSQFLKRFSAPISVVSVVSFFQKSTFLLFLVASQVSLNPLPLISAILAAYFCLLYLKNYHIYHFIVPSKFLFRLHCLLLVNKIHRDGLFEAIELPLFNHQKIYKAVQNHHQIWF